jgi:hypothetical protein
MYLEGQPETTVETDHKSLIWLGTQVDLSPSQAEFLDILARYNLKVKYLKGEKNISADALSRNPEYKAWLEKVDAEYEAMLRKSGGLAARANAVVERPRYSDLEAFLERVSKGYESDPFYKDRTDDDPPFTKLEHGGQTLWYYVTEGDEHPPALCIPDDEALRTQIITEFHEPRTIGHRNAQEADQRLSLGDWWQGMRNECSTAIKNCKICNQNKRDSSGSSHGEMLEKPDIPLRPWDSVTMDFCGPYHPSVKGGPDQVLTVVDRLTKMAHFIPCRTTDTAQMIADLFVDHVIKHHGLALDYRSDRDKIFRSKFSDPVWTRLGSTLALSTAHQHETAGQAERAIQELRKYLAMYTEEHKDWNNMLSLAEFSFNSATNSATGCSPLELNLGYQPRDLTALLPGNPMSPLSKPSNAKAKDADAWLSKLQKNVSEAQSTLQRAHREMKKAYDRRHRPTRNEDGDVVFAPVGSRVYLSTAGLQNVSTLSRDRGAGLTGPVEPKWLPVFLGPFKVLAETGHEKLNRKLELSPSLKERLRCDEFHVSKLKMAMHNGSTLDLSKTIPPPQLHPTSDGEPEYYIEKIIGHADLGKKGRTFKVQGVGYHDPEDFWWVHERDMENAQERMKEYFQNTPRQIVVTRRSAAEQSRKREKKTASANYVNGLSCGAVVCFVLASDNKPAES